MAYKQKSPASVSEGSTGQSSYLDGQLLIGNSTGNTLDKSTLTAGTGVTILNAGGSITLSASGSAALSFPTDSGTATPSANALTIAGGTGINTSGSGSTATINLDSPVLVANGGTGATTLTGVLTGNGTSAVTANAVTQYGTVIAGASNAVSSVAPSATSGVPLISQGASANPVYGTAVVAGGGTGATTFTAGSVIFMGASVLSQDNASLFFDDTNNRLGIGITTPLDTLHVVGAFELDHTAAENDDHALEIVCDANGFTDVKALDIDYITGDMAAGEDEEAIIVNIDETASTGGIMAGYLILSTSEGSATINGYETGVNVNPVVHESGSFGNADNILNKAVDVTAALASGGAGAISIFVADNDTLTVGDAATWDEFEIILATGASGAGVAPTFEYSTGGAGYSAFGPADGTNGFRNTGAILWDSSTLAGWATATSGEFEIRITRTRNTVSTTPIIDELQIAATTEYKWDKDGAVNLNSLTLATDLAVAEGGTGASTLTGVLTGNGTSAVTANAVTQYGTVIAGASNAVSSVAPSATSGVPFISQGASANPVYGTAVVAGGGTGAVSLTDGGIVLGSGTSAVTVLAQATNGQLPIGSTGADCVLASITAGSGMVVTNGAGSISLSVLGGGIPWTTVTDATQALAVNNGYTGNRGTTITYTLPTTAAVGSVIEITNIGAGLPVIAQNADESINILASTTTVGVGGSLTGIGQFCSIKLRCVVADTTWTATSVMSSWTVV